MTQEHTALVNQLYGSVMGHDAEMLDKAAMAIEELSERLERAERAEREYDELWERLEQWRESEAGEPDYLLIFVFVVLVGCAGFAVVADMFFTP